MNVLTFCPQVRSKFHGWVRGGVSIQFTRILYWTQVDFTWLTVSIALASLVRFDTNSCNETLTMGLLTCGKMCHFICHCVQGCFSEHCWNTQKKAWDYNSHTSPNVIRAEFVTGQNKLNKGVWIAKWKSLKVKHTFRFSLGIAEFKFYFKNAQYTVQWPKRFW